MQARVREDGITRLMELDGLEKSSLEIILNH